MVKVERYRIEKIEESFRVEADELKKESSILSVACDGEFDAEIEERLSIIREILKRKKAKGQVLPNTISFAYFPVSIKKCQYCDEEET